MLQVMACMAIKEYLTNRDSLFIDIVKVWPVLAGNDYNLGSDGKQRFEKATA